MVIYVYVCVINISGIYIKKKVFLFVLSVGYINLLNFIILRGGFFFILIY